MHHYTYEITYSDGKKYIGARSCKGLPELDSNYLGSSRHTPKSKILNKEILGIFNSRELAIADEIRLHHLHNVSINPKYYNRSKQTSTRFDTTGTTFSMANTHKEKISRALTGRKRTKQECLNISKGKAGASQGNHSTITKEKIRNKRLEGIAEGRIEGYMKDKKHAPEASTKIYSSRTKYSNKYDWYNTETGQILNATCKEMGLKYGTGIKPTAGFRLVIRGKNKSRGAWVLYTGDV